MRLLRSFECTFLCDQLCHFVLVFFNCVFALLLELRPLLPLTTRKHLLHPTAASVRLGCDLFDFLLLTLLLSRAEAWLMCPITVRVHQNGRMRLLWFEHVRKRSRSMETRREQRGLVHVKINECFFGSIDRQGVCYGGLRQRL